MARQWMYGAVALKQAGTNASAYYGWTLWKIAGVGDTARMDGEVATAIVRDRGLPFPQGYRKAFEQLIEKAESVGYYRLVIETDYENAVRWSDHTYAAKSEIGQYFRSLHGNKRIALQGRDSALFQKLKGAVSLAQSHYFVAFPGWEDCTILLPEFEDGSEMEESDGVGGDQVNSALFESLGKKK